VAAAAIAAVDAGNRPSPHSNRRKWGRPGAHPHFRFLFAPCVSTADGLSRERWARTRQRNGRSPTHLLEFRGCTKLARAFFSGSSRFLICSPADPFYNSFSGAPA
jgi:hypothetical protein